METAARKIGNSIGINFPNAVAREAGERFTIIKVGYSYILKLRKMDIFENTEDLAGFRNSVTSEDQIWDTMRFEGDES